jgi:soluble lytic murein transglycosylase-like protein
MPVRYRHIQAAICAAMLAASMGHATPALAEPATAFSRQLQGLYPINPAKRRQYAPLIEAAARRYRLDPALLHAVISAESGYEPDAVSPRGAIGLMQLMPETATELGVNPWDPAANIDGGARHLARLKRQYPDIRLALAAYNAGEGAVSRHRRTIPPYPETRRYVVRVLHYYMALRQAS